MIIKPVKAGRHKSTGTIQYLVAKHTLEQAEQCAYIIHFKGKYAVQQGTRNILAPMREQLTDRGINATIE